MSEEILRQQLYAAYKNRGMMYYHIFQELRKEVGDEKAAEIMKRGIYNRGLEIGKKYAKFSPADLEGLKRRLPSRRRRSRRDVPTGSTSL